jgi:hypothetical protein
MNARAIPTALSFGQLFLLEEMKSRASALRKKRTRHRKVAFVPNLAHVALLGWLAGLAGAILFQCLWG